MATLKWKLMAPVAGDADTAVITGDLDITNATLNVAELVAADDPEYLIASYTGTLTGSSFANTSGIPNGYGVEIDTAAKTIKLVQIAVLVTESGGSTTATEGGATDTFTVALNAFPSSNVTVTLIPDADMDFGAGAGTAVTLTFSPTNGQTEQTVTVTATDDALVEGPHTGTMTLATAGAFTTSTFTLNNTAGATQIVSSIIDNDAATWSLTGAATVAEGANASYTIALSGILDTGRIGIH